mgnify:FL=1
MDDMLEQARTECAQMSGAQTALNESAKAVVKLLTTVDADVESGSMDLQTAKMAKLYVNRAVAILENMARHTSNLIMTANGKVTALEKAVQSVSSYQETERVKMQVTLSELETTPNVSEPAARPGLSIKERRQAEDRINAPPVAAVVTPIDLIKKRGRPKRKP